MSIGFLQFVEKNTTENTATTHLSDYSGRFDLTQHPLRKFLYRSYLMYFL